MYDGCVSFIYLFDCIKEWYILSYVEDLVKNLISLFVEFCGKCFVILGVRDIVWEKFKYVLL